jgi:hypothetical protein
MTDDQRFAARRPDVLVFETSVLEDIWLLQNILSPRFKPQEPIWTGFMKVIDVFPGDPENKKAPYLKWVIMVMNYK